MDVGENKRAGLLNMYNLCVHSCVTSHNFI